MSRDDDPASRSPEQPTALSSADPIRNFTLTVDERIRALTIGAPAWSVRKRKIEDDVARLALDLVELHDRLVEQGRRRAEIELALVSASAAFDLDKINALVAKHNRYFPIEANLPMAPDGGYLVSGRPWQREEPYSATRVLGMAREILARR